MSTKVAIISDTHGLLRPEVANILKTCDCALHAGDVDEQSTLEELRQLIPIRVVRGNNDRLWIEDLPHSLRFVINGIHFFMVHDRVDVPSDLTGVHVVVFGHSHRYCQQTVKNCLWLNPGSCGKRRYGADLSMAVMYIEDDGQYRVERIDLDPK